jgi:hypothetical protein
VLCCVVVYVEYKRAFVIYRGSLVVAEGSMLVQNLIRRNVVTVEVVNNSIMGTLSASRESRYECARGQIRDLRNINV